MKNFQKIIDFICSKLSAPDPSITDSTTKRCEFVVSREVNDITVIIQPNYRDEWYKITFDFLLTNSKYTHPVQIRYMPPPCDYLSNEDFDRLDYHLDTLIKISTNKCNFNSIDIIDAINKAIYHKAKSLSKSHPDYKIQIRGDREINEENGLGELSYLTITFRDMELLQLPLMILSEEEMDKSVIIQNDLIQSLDYLQNHFSKLRIKYFRRTTKLELKLLIIGCPVMMVLLLYPIELNYFAITSISTSIIFWVYFCFSYSKYGEPITKMDSTETRVLILAVLIVFFSINYFPIAKFFAVP